MRTINKPLLTLLLIGASAAGFAQPVATAPESISKLIDDALLGAIGKGNPQSVTNHTILLALSNHKAQAADPLAPIATELSTAINQQRTDVQLGAPSDSPQTTSVLEKPGIADLLSVALDRGAITKTEAGTGLTLSTTPYAIVTAFGLHDTPQAWDRASAARNVSLSATFSSTDVTKGDFSSFTSGEIKWIIHGNRSPRDLELLRGVRKNLGPIFRIVDADIDKACGSIPTLQEETAMKAWFKDHPSATVPEAHEALDKIVSSMVVDSVTLKSCVDVVLKGEQSISGGLNDVTKATKAYLADKPNQFSIAADLVRDSMISDYYSAKLLYGRDTNLLTMNLNAEASWNKDSVSAMGVPIRSLRDYSVELGVNSKTLANGRLDWSVAAKAMRDKTIDAKSIVVSEARVNLHLTDTLRLPIAATYANRETETVKQGWQLNVGLNAFLDDVLRNLK